MAILPIYEIRDSGGRYKDHDGHHCRCIANPALVNYSGYREVYCIRCKVSFTIPKRLLRRTGRKVRCSYLQ